LSREGVEQKARRYLTEGRLNVIRAGPEGVDATCRGTETVHRLGYRAGRWFCSCPARSRCCHVAALQLVALPAGPRQGVSGSVSTSSSTSIR
jgi:hypothetical protein